MYVHVPLQDREHHHLGNIYDDFCYVPELRRTFRSKCLLRTRARVGTFCAKLQLFREISLLKYASILFLECQLSPLCPMVLSLMVRTVGHLTTLAPSATWPSAAVAALDCSYLLLHAFSQSLPSFLPSFRPSRPFDSVGFLPFDPATRAHIHSFDTWKSKSAQFFGNCSSGIFCLACPPPFRFGSVRSHVIVHSEQNMRAWGPLTSL